MQPSILALFLCASAAADARTGLQTSVTPLNKVLQMLGDMSAKAITEKKDEEIRFASFQRFCDYTGADKAKSIDSSNQQMEQLTADIAVAESDAEALGREVEALDANLNVWQGDQKAAAKIRSTENADYRVVHQDYSESMDALDRAIVALKKRAADVAQSPELVQLERIASSSLHFPSSVKRTLSSFVQTGVTSLETFEDYVQPQANAYEFQSGGVIAMLEKLKKKFWDERSTLEKEEMNKRFSYERISQDLHDQIEAATEQRAQKAMARSGRKEDAARAKGDLASTTQMRDDDAKYLADMRTECHQKSSDYENRQVLRAGEIEAIAKATEILSSPAVAGAAGKHLPAALLQGPSLAQLRSHQAASPLLQRVSAFLSEKAAKSNSHLLAALADNAANDPFQKVKKMIQDLIVKLMEEANAEADHKGWCDTELATNQQTRDELSSNVAELTAQVDELTALTGKLGQDIADLSDAIAEIDTAMAKATADRAAEKEKNAETVSEAKGAQTALMQAIAVLKDYYANAAEATSLLQQEPPATFDTPYKGMQAESGGILGMLEVIRSDFARLESETSSAEDSGQKDFERFSADSAEDKAVKQTEVDHKTNRKQLSESKLATAKKDVKITQSELFAALDYYEKLKPSCVDSGLSYGDRVERRKAEIDSLKEALEILSSDAPTL